MTVLSVIRRTWCIWIGRRSGSRIWDDLRISPIVLLELQYIHRSTANPVSV